MYGLGVAESELSPILALQRDRLTVLTKFGIDMTPVGRLLGRVQGPVRSAMALVPAMSHGARRQAQGPDGVGGRLLYEFSGYAAQSAERSLDRSLRQLKTDYVDVFALHEPLGRLAGLSPQLCDYLATEQSRGRIRTWGVAGDLHHGTRRADHLYSRAPILQYRHDVVVPPELTPRPTGTIRFGILTSALPALTEHLRTHPATMRRWRSRHGAHVLTDGLPDLIFRHSLRQDRNSPVLVTTTRRPRLERLMSAAQSLSDLSPVDEDFHALLEDVRDPSSRTEPA